MSSQQHLFVIILVILMIAPAVADEPPEDPPVPAPEPDWTMTVDNRYPYLGDPVIITIGSVYMREFAVVDIFMDDVRVKQILIRTNSTHGTEAIWETRLDMEPVKYTLILVYYGKILANATVTLIYDPLDFAMKTLLLHEEEMEQLRREDDFAEAWSTLALRQNDYQNRWIAFSMAVTILNLVILYYILPDAWRKFIKKRIRLRRASKAWGTLAAGTIQYDLGKETMMDTPVPREPTPGETAWCPECERLVHRAEWKMHADHKLDLGGHRPVPRRRVVVTQEG